MRGHQLDLDLARRCAWHDQLSLMLFICFSYLTVASSLEKIPSICHRPCKTSMNGTATLNFCESHSELRVSGRCCVNETQPRVSVVGIDLQNCSLTEKIFSTGIQNISTLQYISLEGNSIKQLQNTDFHRNTDIAYLSLPPDFSCPGSDGTWLREIFNGSATECFNEQNACVVHNVTCPSNSHCVHSGVDMTECLCDDGFHGYKCMEQGVFPLKSFLIGITIPTVALCIFMYVTQRRHVGRQQARKVR